MDVSYFIVDKALYMIPALYVLGVFLKNTPRFPDWLIPWTLTAIGIAGSCSFLGINIEGVTQGILTAGATVLGNQLLKQSFNREG